MISNEIRFYIELVELNVNNLSETPLVLLDLSAYVINTEFYATTYDACKDVYYLTSRSDNDSTDFYKLNLESLFIETESFPFYLMGIESKI